MREASDLRRTPNLCRPGSPVASHLELGSALQFRPRHLSLTLTKRDHPLMVFSLESAVWFGFASICTGGRKGCEMRQSTGELNIYRHQTICEKGRNLRADPSLTRTDLQLLKPRLTRVPVFISLFLLKLFESLMFAFSCLLRSSKTMNLCSKCFAGESNLEAFCRSDRPHRVGCNVLTHRPTNHAVVVQSFTAPTCLFASGDAAR